MTIILGQIKCRPNGYICTYTLDFWQLYIILSLIQH